MTVELITRFVKILIVFVLVWTGLWVFNNFGCSRVEGPEMAPTIPAEKNAWIDPKIRHPEQLQRDDIIAYSYDVSGRGTPKKVTARVIGLPGDRVKLVKGEVHVDGKPVSGGSTDKKYTEDFAEIIVPRNTVYVLCDNRAGNTRGMDSRTLGPVGAWAIIGKIR